MRPKSQVTSKIAMTTSTLRSVAPPMTLSRAGRNCILARNPHHSNPKPSSSRVIPTREREASVILIFLSIATILI